MAEMSSSSAYIGWKLETFLGVFIPLQVVIVALRFYARWLVVGLKFTIEDALVLVTLFLQLILSGLGVAVTHHAGVGYHVAYLEEHDPSKLLAWGKHLLAIATIYFFVVLIPKIAILIFYKRLFPMRNVQYLIYATGAILVCSGTANTIVSLAACTPFEANYNPTLPGAKCIDKEKFYVWTSIPNIVTDCVMLVLPLPIIWNLHNTARMKVGLTFTFLVGSFGLVTSILRFCTFFANNSFTDGTWSAVDLIIWTVTEPGIYLISACLMTYRPLIERIGRFRTATIFSRYGSHSRPEERAESRQDLKPEFHRSRRSFRLKNMRKSDLEFTELGSDEATFPINGLGMNSIKCTTDIENRWSDQGESDSQSRENDHKRVGEFGNV